MQKAVQSIEDTKRQYCEVLCNETILKYCANVFLCLRAWGLSAESMGSKKQTWDLSDLEPKLIANQIWAFLQLESKVMVYPLNSFVCNNLITMKPAKICLCVKWTC